uniref:Down syndrome cell adhesion molecule n=1 Tax=Strigamia maritima TaxID=126957 RepID=T1J197_STRMM
PGGPPLSIELEPVSSQSLRVKWKPPKNDLWFGDLTGYNIGYREVDSEEDYIVKSTDHRPDENVYLISNLKKSFSYGVVISAFNGKGSGPQSAEVVASTLEDVPSQSPHNVKCSTLSSNVILVTWKAPKIESIHGVLQGYKLYYESDSNFKEKSSVTTKATQMELTKLRSFSNYTVSVAAYTRAGDGLFSETIQCQTLESVPGPPAEIKALVMSSDAILVSWLPPRNPNGIITKYSIFMKKNGQQERDAMSYSLPANQLYYEARGLQENIHYEFWVTTATSVGDGAKSPLVSNDKKITQESRFQFASDGSLNMANVRSSDSGNYTCSIHNIYATDELTHEVIVQIDKERTGPPTPPVVKFTPLSTSSILASWYVDDDGSTAIESYTLNYKRAGEDWQDLHFGFNITNYTLPDLQCGTRYQLYMSAYNRLGQSRPSEVTLISTLGKAPIVPPKDSFISVNSTFVSLNLRAWQSVDPEVCKVKHLSVDYRAFNQKEWTLLMQSVKVEQNSFAISDLSSGVTYVLRITAHSDTGLTIADFDVMLSQENDALPDSSLQNYNKHYRFYLDINVIISTVVLFAVVVFLLTIGCYLVHRKRYTGYKQGNPPKHHYVQNESQKQSQFQKTQCNDHQQYSPTTHKELSTTEAALFSSSGATQDDICPYATYQLPGCLMEDSIELRTFNPPSIGSELLQSANVLPINVVYSKVKKHPKSIKVDYDEMQRKEIDYEKELLYCKENPCLTQLYCDVLPHKIYSKSVIATGPSPNHYDGLSLKRYAEKQSCNLQVLEPVYNTRQFNTGVPDLLYHQQDSTSSNESSPPESESGLSSQNNRRSSLPALNKDNLYCASVQCLDYKNRLSFVITPNTN